MAKKLFLRFATSQDEQSVFDFYAQNRHTFVFQRDPEVWKERIASGAVTIIEDDQGKIVASTISYPITKKDSTGNEVHEWTELGSLRVTLDGLGLAKTIVSAQVMRAYMFEPPNDRFVMEIVLGNNHSKHVFTTKMGATPFDIPHELERKVKSTITSGNDFVEWFQMGVETIPEMARNVLNVEQSPILKNPKTGEEYELDFSRCTLISQFHSQIEDIARQDFGDIKKPDYTKGLNNFKPRAP